MLKVYLVLIFFFIIILVNIVNIESFENSNIKNPCIDYLSDKEFLEHMIPHHQVAIDMSILLIKTTNNPIMKDLCRDIIWQQKYEITMMKEMINKLPKYELKSNSITLKTKLEYYEPKNVISKTGECNPLFFKPDEHMENMKHMKIDDRSYLEHMIPHHQVAVDMSKRLLLHTKNTYMMSLCYDLITEQQNEILMMNQMLNNFNKWQYKSTLI